MQRPIDGAFNDGELGRLYELMRRAYHSAKEILAFDVRQIIGAETDQAGASRDKKVLRVPSGLLTRVRTAAGSMAPPKAKLARSEFLKLVEYLLGAIMYEEYEKKGDTTAMIFAPRKFWGMLPLYWFDSYAVYRDKADLTKSYT